MGMWWEESPEHYVGRRAMVMKVQGRRKRGRPKRRWLDKVTDDIKEKGQSAGDVYDRATWRSMYVIVHWPHIKVGIRWRRRSPQQPVYLVLNLHYILDTWVILLRIIVWHTSVPRFTFMSHKQQANKINGCFSEKVHQGGYRVWDYY